MALKSTKVIAQQSIKKASKRTGRAKNIAKALQELKSTVSSPELKSFESKHLQQGQRSEMQALSYLETQGFVFWARNFRTLFAEVDLILEKDQRLYLVEVKTLASWEHLPHRVNKKQIQRLQRASQWVSLELDREVLILWAFVLKTGPVFILDDYA